MYGAFKVWFYISKQTMCRLLTHRFPKGWKMSVDHCMAKRNSNRAYYGHQKESRLVTNFHRGSHRGTCGLNYGHERSTHQKGSFNRYVCRTQAEISTLCQGRDLIRALTLEEFRTVRVP